MPFYEFIVRDNPAIDFADLEVDTGLRCLRSGRIARFDGELIDSAALEGVLWRLFQLGVDLVAIECSSADPSGELPGRPQHGGRPDRASDEASRNVRTP